ncbi:MAG TPA: DUF4142 domain-containing protein [Candidatus Eisenbacteria bacterium]|nr:DUF4142 domain-containing protein [Candidatus Eisenbacteria bacterium]
MQTRIRHFALALAPALLAVLLLPGCGKKESETSSTMTGSESTGTATMPAESTATGAAGGGQLSDANIAAIVLAANDADISNGKMAKAKTKNSDVRAFAEMMITDHGSSNKQAKDLAGRLKLTPEDNDASKGLKTSADATRDSLKKMKGAAFDKAYIDNEVAYHTQVLSTIDNTLIPNAQNADLKKLLQDTRPVVSHHLDRAKEIQGKLGGGAWLAPGHGARAHRTPSRKA